MVQFPLEANFLLKNLIFTAKQYKNDNYANLVWLRKNSNVQLRMNKAWKKTKY